jgi:hypothetical protein
MCDRTLVMCRGEITGVFDNSSPSPLVAILLLLAAWFDMSRNKGELA